MTDHPITPPPELVRKWNEEAATAPMADQRYIAIQAARWGSDQELEACCGWMTNHFHGMKDWTAELRAARRPKPPSLKEQALEAAQRFYAKGHENCTDEEVKDDFDTIRRALEQLDD